MHENAPVLAAKPRERVGSRYAQRARAAGGLPAVVYGHKQEPVAVTLDAHEALQHFHKGEKVFQLQLEGSESEFVLLKDLQYDHLGTHIVHADLARVNLNERVQTSVPVHLIGAADCVGLKTAGTTLMHPTSELELECVVTNLPEFIEVDIRDLKAHGTIHAKDVQLPAPTMKLLTDPDAVVAHIVMHGGDADSDEATEVGASTGPEVITAKKEGA